MKWQPKRNAPSAVRRTTPASDKRGRGEEWDVKNGEDVLRQIFRLLKFERDTAEAEVQHASAAGALLANDGVGIRANHGDALGFTLNRIRSWR